MQRGIGTYSDEDLCGAFRWLVLDNPLEFWTAQLMKESPFPPCEEDNDENDEQQSQAGDARRNELFRLDHCKPDKENKSQQQILEETIRRKFHTDVLGRMPAQE